MPTLPKAARRRKRLQKEQARSRAADDFARFGERGQELHEAGRWAEAIASYRRALAANPRDRQARVVAINLAQCLMELGRLDEAEAAAQAARCAYPDFANAHATLAAIYDHQRRRNEAAESFREAVRLDPQEAFYRANLARVEIRRLNFDEGVAQLETAARLAPKCSEHWRELAQAYEHTARWAEADIALATSIALDPRNAEAISTQGFKALRRGDYAAAWADVERRPDKGKVRGSTEWKGGDLAGKTLLVVEEGGIGDTFQFARYLPELCRRAARVYFRCRPGLHELLNRSLPGVWYASDKAAVAPPHDCYICTQSIPAVLETTLETIPAPLRLIPDPDRVEFWKDKLARLSDGKRAIGLFWQGSTDYKGDYTRSMDAETLVPLASLPNVQCFSLQLGAGPPPLGVHDLAPRLTSLDETAAVVAALDLVVGVDSMLGHLAGNLGTPTWLLLPALADWRWLEHRSDSPWYPATHRLWRQDQLGDWSGPADRICHALRDAH